MKETEYIFKNHKEGTEIKVNLKCDEENDDLRDELAYDLLIKILTEEIKDKWYIDDVLKFKE